MTYPDWPLPHPDHPLYAPLAPLPELPRWPSQADFDALVARARAAGAALPPGLRFACDLEPERYYEAHIAATGEVPTRSANWHDWFNALSWLAWPRAKAALNARHMRAIARGEVKRGPLRDAATLFDECGIIVLACDAAPLDALAGMRWHELFVAGRENWGTRVAAVPFGHALMEQGLNMHIGWCGKALPLTVDADFFALPAAAQREALDARLAELLADDANLATPRALLPLPLLGIPGWWDANRDPAFYDDTGYFRASRRAKSASVVVSKVSVSGRINTSISRAIAPSSSSGR
ncbi:DUF3025 domain-containing protein [Crenobacter luteus]|uniref:DUF3025 domain-containing protein n=1 Tax=Crenobacter luteus TaxID=1452487 RepID=UPI000AD9EFD6|nr:DUF3025 domain-containing protein [Crenobacter luteus]